MPFLGSRQTNNTYDVDNRINGGFGFFQVMVSADVHNMKSPSPLPTPGYLPLLSEASTPMSPATLHEPLSLSSTTTGNSPRISFRSFTLPLELDEDLNKRRSTSSEKAPSPSHRLSAATSDCSARKSYERILESPGSSMDQQDRTNTVNNF